MALLSRWPNHLSTSGGEEHAIIRLTGAPSDDFGEEGFPHAGIADKDRAISLELELQIEQTANTRLQVEAALVVFEVEAVDGMLQTGKAEAPFNRTEVAGFQVKVYPRRHSGLHLQVVAENRLGHRAFVAVVGSERRQVLRWAQRYGKINQHNGSIPRDFWLIDWEKKAILDFQLLYPVEG
jgi:hypothetical protein